MTIVLLDKLIIIRAVRTFPDFYNIVGAQRLANGQGYIEQWPLNDNCNYKPLMSMFCPHKDRSIVTKRIHI